MGTIKLPYDVGEAMKSEGMPALGILPVGMYLMRVDELKDYTSKKDKESVLCALTIADMQAGLPGRDDIIGRKFLHFFQKSRESSGFIIRFALACGVKGLTGFEFDGDLFTNKMVIAKVEENNKPDGTIGSQINGWEPAEDWKRYGGGKTQATTAKPAPAAKPAEKPAPAAAEPAAAADEQMEMDFPF